MGKSILKERSYLFAVRLVNLVQFVQREKKEYVLTKQVLRSGTAVGAMVREGEFAQSRADFVNKMSQALKESNETLYWLDLLFDTDYISKEQHDSLQEDCQGLVSMLAASVKTAKRGRGK